MLRTDGSIACVGNNRAGMLSFTGATAAANYSTFFTPSFSAQGTITDVIVGFQVVSLMTSNGSIWNAGQIQWRGLGIITNVWADNNKFQQVPLPEAVLGMRGFHEVSNNNEGVYVLTTNYGVIGWGSNTVTRINANSNEAYSPRIMTELYGLNNGIARSNPPKLAADEVGSITDVTASTVTDIVDGVNGQTVTFKVNYTGGVFGTLPITASVTGADITEVALLTNSVIITGASGSFDVQFTINAADIPALVPPNTQAQNYVLTLTT
jgi:alpha-tubulin suppressor-like RCC1 family protein